ncbi:MAG TPA: futalosine hydrolase [Bacteroidia bacterium]|nr:futalosine hydrolase [Bacteroidia bacterium]
MKILLVSATALEINPFVSSLGKAQLLNKHLSKYFYHDLEIDVLVTGVGMVFTAFYLGIQLNNQKYNLVINAGVAGAIDKELQLGEVVHVVQDYFYELGAEDNASWLSISDLGLLSNNDLPYTANGLTNQNFLNIPQLNSLKQVKAHTVNKVHGHLQSIEIMKQRSQAQIESMEGAAFLFCCLKMDVPCVQIRAISNYVEVRNKANWKMIEAVEGLNFELSEIFQNLLDIKMN